MGDMARFVVVKTLCDIEEKKSFSNIKLNQYFKKYDLSPIDRAFATEILYGTIRWKLRIDYFIQKFSKVKIKDMSTWVLCCIRTAVYQIFFMDKVPDFAAVNQAVEITKIRDKKASSFVNGVLRNILRNKNEFNNINIKDRIKKLSVEYSHPEWMIKKFTEAFGEKFVISLMEKNNTPPELSIRINTLKTTKEELKELLINKGIDVKEGRVPECLMLKGYHSIEKSEEFNNGLFTIQDESSMLVAKVLSPMPGERIIDLCSAPGGKTTHIAQLMNNNGEITALDIHEHKLLLVNDNAKRLGIDIIKTYLKDATTYIDEFKDYADRVLIDAPCSGIGLIRKKPEIRWNISEKDIIELQKVQYSILKNAAKYVKVGGVIVYSTCTITMEENEDIIKRFLNEHSNFELENICGILPERLSTSTCSSGYVKLFPNVHDTDGFFISRLRRKR
jgi:16S rRNA (cytosine967-C5)-methyltransferase